MTLNSFENPDINYFFFLIFNNILILLSIYGQSKQPIWAKTFKLNISLFIERIHFIDYKLITILLKIYVYYKILMFFYLVSMKVIFTLNYMRKII